MQRIERYGVIALVFLLVTILAVSLWGEGEDGGLFASFLGGGEEVVVADAKKPERAEPPARRASQEKALPISGSPKEGARNNKRTNKPKAGQPAGGVRTLPSPGNGAAARPATPRKASPVVQAETQKPAKQPAAPPSSRPAKPQQAVAGTRSHKVQPGETLSEIAQAQLGTYKRWPEIQALNGGLDPAKVRPGMVLKLPARGAAAKPATSPAKPTVAERGAKPKSKPTVNGHTYVVKSGDVLSVIAQRELGSAARWREIVALNPAIDADRLAVGARLSMPAGAARVSQVAKLTPSSGRSGGKKVR